MTILLVAENRNQAQLALRLAPELAGLGHACRFATLRWINPLGGAEAFAESGVEPELIDGFMPEHAVRHYRRFSRIEQIKRFVPQLHHRGAALLGETDALVLFNDTSGVSRALSTIAKSWGIPVALVQDGFLGFDPNPRPEFWPLLARAERVIPRLFTPGKDFALAVRRRIPRSEFGQSLPDAAFVWGRAMADRVCMTQRMPAERLHVTGAVQFEGLDLAAPAHRVPREPTVLLADQCLAKYGAIREEDWRRELPRLLEALRGRRVIYKFHPSEDASRIEWVRSLGFPNVEFADEPVPELLRRSDVLLTFFSTAFIDALGAGRPTIAYAMPGITVRLPRMGSPLVHEADMPEQVVSIIGRLAGAEPPRPEAPRRFLAAVGAAGAVARGVAALAASRPLSPADRRALAAARVFQNAHARQMRALLDDRLLDDGLLWEEKPFKRSIPELEHRIAELEQALREAMRDPKPPPPPKPAPLRVDPAFTAARFALRAARRLARRARPSPAAHAGESAAHAADLVVFARGYARGRGGGDLMIIREYAAHATGALGLRVELLDPDDPEHLERGRRLLAAGAPALFNGVATVESRRFLALVRASSRAFLYLHETEWVLAKLARTMPARLRDLAACIDRIHVLSSTERQDALVRDAFPGVRGSVIYNAVRLVPPPRATRASGGRVRVVMTGSAQPRKGVTLFSRTADLAARRGLPWSFDWIGRPLGFHEPFFERKPYFSPHVHWLPEVSNDEIHARVAEADVVLLSSVDDPLPRSAMEAVALGARLVYFDELALADLLAGRAGYRGFGPYRAEAALEAVERVLQETPDPAFVDHFCRTYVCVDALARRIHDAVGIPHPAPSAPAAPAPRPAAMAT